MPESITTSKAAEASGHDVQWIRRLARAGKIGAKRKGRDKFQAYLATMTELGNRRHDPRGIPNLVND